MSVVVVLVVISTFAAIFYKPVRGPVLARTVQRAVLVVLAQGLAVLLCAVLVNNWGSFYGSWNDLLRGDKPLTTTGAGYRLCDFTIETSTRTW